MKKVNLFLIMTEYHFFTTMSVISDEYSNAEEFENIILHPCAEGKSRLPEFKELPFNASFEKLILDQTELIYHPNLKKELNKYLNKKVSTFITFFEQKPLCIYLIHKFSRQGVRVVLAPDGNIPYISLDKGSFTYLFKKTLKHHLFLLLNKLWIWKIFLMSTTYASFKEIEEVWVTEPDLYNNKTNKKLKKLNILASKKAVEAVSEVYGFSFERLEMESRGILLYINNNYYNPKGYGVELEVLREVSEQNPQLSIYIKPHPQTPEEQLNEFRKIPKVKFIYTKVPAELIIANLENSIILSFWSAALMVDNPSCKFYWLYPIMMQKGALDRGFQIVNPTTHLKVIDNISEINFQSVTSNETQQS